MKKFSLSVILVLLAVGNQILYGGNDGLDHKTLFNIQITNLHAPRTQGDGDFFDNGPSVKAAAKLSLQAGNTELWISLALCEQETKTDWTTFNGKWDKLLWTVPSGYIITHICTDEYSQTEYVDSNFNMDYPAVTGGLLVKTFEIHGDDFGNDDAWMNVYLNPITVKIDKK